MAWYCQRAADEDAFFLVLYCDDCGQEITREHPGCVTWAEGKLAAPPPEPLRFVHSHCFNKSIFDEHTPSQPAVTNAQLVELHCNDLADMHRYMLSAIMSENMGGESQTEDTG